MSKDIRKVGVVGAGNMGAAIAQHFLMKGLQVHLVDVSEEGLTKGRERIDSSLEEAVKRRIMRPEDKASLFERLVTTTDFKTFAECQLIVEAVFENFQVKVDLFTKLEEYVADDCVLATNTSSYSVADLAKCLKKPERFIGVHYFYHAAKNKLVEVIPGEKTDPRLVEVLRDFYNYYDKIPIVVKDAAGFAVNRFFVPWLNEAVRLYEEGLGSPAFIDETAEKLFKIGMGPFKLMNATGVPVAQHACEGLAEKFGAFYAPAEGLKKQVATKTDWDLAVAYSGKNDEKAVTDRLLAASLGVAAQMVSEGVTTTSETDLGARMGLRWFQGPFELMNAIGVDRVKTATGELFKKWNLPMPKLLEQTPQGGRVALDFVKATVQGECGFLQFYRPDSMNALNEEVVQQLSDKWDELEKNSQVKKIVLLGSGKAFVAGADIKFFIDNMDKGDVDRIYNFTAFGHEVLKKIESSAKPSIAYLDGLTLGGGLELALACKFRLGTARSLLAFPETGIGIYPGLGGTQRSTRLMGKAAAKYLVATGKMIKAEEALALGLIDQVIERVGSWTELEKMDFPQSASGKKGQPELDAFAEFDGVLTDDLLAQPAFAAQEKALRSKAPLALSKAMDLIDQGEKLDLNKGLEMELAGLREIFSTADARIGLGSVIKRERPAFKGA
ncbi:MAG: enoyl-CoA hydratase/isomerase family protein [Bdellovibrionaceae bacterium]|nr:enoyl-CoA hydratase/isomerase family protein [Bdellovibrionales bacterium]MCB9083812.1 enoyl-CoA hydratase/isomerase family protein [Pseudobdellovibrionaceae bacterium]